MSLAALDLVRAAVLMMDQRKELWALPVLATCCSMTAWGVGLYFVVGGWNEEGLMSSFSLLLIPTWFIASFSHVYFQVALAGSLASNDKDRRMDEGMAQAGNCKAAIAKWTLLNGLARGTLLLVGRQAGFIPGLAWLGGMAWTTATFMVPAVLAQGEGVRQAIGMATRTAKHQLSGGTLGFWGVWASFRCAQVGLGALGAVAIWGLFQAQWPIAGVGIGIVMGTLILGLDAVQQALTMALARQILDQENVRS